MIRVFDSSSLSREDILTRENPTSRNVEQTVSEILADVKANGDDALRTYSKKYDGADLTSLEVTRDETERAIDGLDRELLAVLEEAAANIHAFHLRQVQHSFVINDTPGVVLGQKVLPLERAGIYVPGGTASYPSTVLMNCIPAKTAGVAQVIMTTPPNRDGTVSPVILAAASIAGVDRIFKVGGAQAVAALAYGTQSIPRVDKIVGPGNIYVAEAKRQVFGLVNIDMIAGPSEILIVADGGCEAKIVAADMLAQAEHDKNASAVLVTDSQTLAREVSRELERQIPLLPRAEIARASIDTNGKIILVQSLDEAIDIANAIAPEHLELCVDEPFRFLAQIRNAGAVFLGKHCPEALGDYFAGTNHTLPTGGTARFSSPLGVEDFVKRSSFLYYTKDALEKVSGKIIVLARQEGLEAHGISAAIRFEK